MVSDVSDGGLVLVSNEEDWVGYSDYLVHRYGEENTEILVMNYGYPREFPCLASSHISFNDIEAAPAVYITHTFVYTPDAQRLLAVSPIGATACS